MVRAPEIRRNGRKARVFTLRPRQASALLSWASVRRYKKFWRECTMNFKPIIALIAVAGAFASAVLPASAQDFYKGKTLTIIVGFSPGGTYDVTARVLARHIGDHIPGKPSVVVQTMTGAGGSESVMHLYNNAVRDGTVIGMPPRNYPIAPFSNDQLRYDGSRFIALGSTTTEVQVGAVWHAAGVSKFDDLMKREISAGITSYTDDIGSQTQLTKVITGAKLKVVSGYPGGNDISAAMEKGEVDSEFGWSWGSIKTRAKQWLDEKKINIVFQIGAEKAPDLPDVPFIMDYAKNDLDRHALELLMAPDAFAWPFVAPPGVPADRVTLLRRAFDETMKDPSFLADAKKVSLEVNPISGEAIQARIEHILGFDSSVIARAKELVKPPPS
jgi:tripartite-type tricarboxylate transporter receptor subunit TctC